MGVKRAPPAAQRPEVLVEVTLSCHELVVPGGTRTTSWYVREQERWLMAHRHPSARREQQNAGPGTVWEETLHLRLPPGARLKQVVQEPTAGEARALFDYLRKEIRGVTRTNREREFAVDEKGRLTVQRSRHTRGSSGGR